MINEDIHDDAGARRMLDILTDSDADPERRGQAAIKLGPGLQLCDERLDWDDIDLFFGKATFEQIDKTFRRLYHDAATPRLVRRRILEAAVRFPLDWHDGAIRAAWESDDLDWQRTAMLGMGYVPGFEEQIMEVLEREAPPESLLYEAVRAAGNRAIDEAEPIIRRIALDDDYATFTREHAMNALIWCGNEASDRALERLSRHSDPDIADMAEWALGERRMFDMSPEDLMGFDDEFF
ncbi:MAG: HEAT repeat domain-containing protein [Myxococcota bacterium]